MIIITEPKWYDLTLSKDKEWTRERFIEIAEPICERFAVADEVGEGGYEHLQARVVFKIGKEFGAVANLFPGAHISPSHTRDFEYCKKEGNFYLSWEKSINKWANIELKTWQQDLLKFMDKESEREIIVVFDPDGNKGKTYFSKYCVATHRATYCPPLADAQDIMAFAMAKPDKAYIFDMPRAEDIKKAKGLWSAIEQIKNGYLYDKRYNFRDMWIDPPKIVVFCNELPNLDTLSRDRWRIYRFGTIGGTRECIYEHTVSQ